MFQFDEQTSVCTTSNTAVHFEETVLPCELDIRRVGADFVETSFGWSRRAAADAIGVLINDVALVSRFRPFFVAATTRDARDEFSE